MTPAQEQAFLQLMQHLIYASDLIEKLLLLVGDDLSDDVAAELRRRADEIASKVDRGALDSEVLIRAALARRAALRVFAVGTDHDLLARERRNFGVEVCEALPNEVVDRIRSAICGGD